MFAFLRSAEPTLAIDLGTRNILISNHQRVLFRQQNVAACSRVSDSQKKTYIVGELAEEVFEKNPGHYEIIKPLSKGVICDFDHCSEIVGHALKSVMPRSLRKPGLLVSVPLDVSDMERVAFVEVLHSLNFPSVEIVSEPVAAAVGLIPNFAQKNGVLLVDVGAGISEAVVFAKGGVVCNTSTRLGGEDFESEIISYIRRHYDFQIGNRAALFLLDILSREHPDSYLQPIEIKGFDLRLRMPSTLKVELKDIEKSLDHLFMHITQAVLNVLELAPEELSSEIMENGIQLTGGGSQYKRLMSLLKLHTGLEVLADSQALLGVARGEIALLQDSKLRKSLI